MAGRDGKNAITILLNIIMTMKYCCNSSQSQVIMISNTGCVVTSVMQNVIV